MVILHNVISNKELKSKMLCDNVPRITISFYKYFPIINTQIFRKDWYITLYNFNVFGRIYIAREGINAQISIPNNVYDNVKRFIRTYSNDLKNVYINRSLDNKQSFWVLRIKVKKTILSDNLCKELHHVHYDGVYLESVDVNNMLNKNNVIFLDIRNHYEYKIGHFERAINIPVNTFRRQLKEIVSVLQHKKNEQIVIYCTGGIRCEKASSWMMYNGFKYVYQIKGGIIGYVNDAKKNCLPVLFKGKNFVFDERMSEIVSHDILSKCSQCENYCDVYKNCYNNSCHNLFIQCIKCSKKFKNCCSYNCMIINHYRCNV